MTPSSPPALTPGQQGFVDQFLLERNAKSLLVAEAGTGKTMTSLVAASRMVERGLVDALFVISSRVEIRDQWRHAADQYGLELADSVDSILRKQGVSATLQSLRMKTAEGAIMAAAKANRWLIIADDTGYETQPLVHLVDLMLSRNAESRALFISSAVPVDVPFAAEFRFTKEFILDREILESPQTEIRVARSAPSFTLLRDLQRGAASIDNVSWRDFERLIAELLERDGYSVELMQGSKDGGVDVVAVKNLAPSGCFKVLWQAKKLSLPNKVGLSVVRELADTRQQLGASKGVIVTSAYLTLGALNRVDRDKYILGKVDRDDLAAWISRTLFGE